MFSSGFLQAMANDPVDVVDATGTAVCEVWPCDRHWVFDSDGGESVPFILRDRALALSDGDVVTLQQKQTRNHHFTVPVLCSGDQCQGVVVSYRRPETPICQLSSSHACMERGKLRALHR